MEETLGYQSQRRAKTFLWQITMHGLYMMDRAHKLGHGDGFCRACPGTAETLEHIFFNYPKAQCDWARNALVF